MATLKDSPVASGQKPEKKNKKNKSDRKEKKRSREDEAEAGEERKHKRSKSAANSVSRNLSPDLSTGPQEVVDNSTLDVEKSAKKKSHKRDKHREAGSDDEVEGAAEGTKEKKKRKKSKHQDEEDATVTQSESASAKKDKKDKRKKKRHDDESPALRAEEESAAAALTDEAAGEAMDLDDPAQPVSKSTSGLHQPPDTPAKPRYPFFTQTVSLFLPLYPVGWAEPCTAAATQHLEPMVNRYVPTLGGVLLAFRNVAVSEQPGRDGAATSDSEVCDVLSIDEYAVGFGWVSAEVDLFIPKRGAWMEGSINLESEGHIGVVCWGKFNASIESARLPPEWRWVNLGSEEANAAGFTDDTVSLLTAEQEHGAVRQIHATGYWVDGAGSKVKGRVRFRIKSFDVGVSGDHGYLSLEGTMLDAEGEQEAAQRDAQQELRRRRGKHGGSGLLAKERRLVPEFSVTRFGQVEDEEDKALQKEVWDTTEPAPEHEGQNEAEGFAGISKEDV